MAIGTIISNDRQAREAATLIGELTEALSDQQVLKSIVEGLPKEAIEGVRKSLTAERRELTSIIEAYDSAKNGSVEALEQKAGSDLGALLIVARIAKGLSQKELARKLGLREQAVQRYEAEKYRTINLANFQKFSNVLGITWTPNSAKKGHANWEASFDVEPAILRKVLKHARLNSWFDGGERSDEDAIGQLMRYVADHVVRHGTPSLLRTGMNVVDHSQDWSLLSWKAQVTRRAELIILDQKLEYRSLDVAWLLDLVKLSAEVDGPRMAVELLQKHGIVFIAEPHVTGMSVDGAAFIVDQVPVIGMTLLRDTVDNFWFTLLHEVAHIILHFRTGLSSGFFDDFQSPDVDGFEEEANSFASNMLIPEEVWRRSPARIARTAAPVEKLADQLHIHPAIIFGRIRMERNDYALFSNKIGRGAIRKQFFSV